LPVIAVKSFPRCPTTEYFTDGSAAAASPEEHRSDARLNVVATHRRQRLVFNLFTTRWARICRRAPARLEADYKKELKESSHPFTNLFTITSINRFRLHLEKSEQYESYMRSAGRIQSSAAQGVMCRSIISVDHEGFLYDCDFNQMLSMHVTSRAVREHLRFRFRSLDARHIRFDYALPGGTAAAGFVVGGATA